MIKENFYILDHVHEYNFRAKEGIHVNLPWSAFYNGQKVELFSYKESLIYFAFSITVLYAVKTDGGNVGFPQINDIFLFFTIFFLYSGKEIVV